MTTITAQQVAELRAKATPGPWYVRGDCSIHHADYKIAKCTLLPQNMPGWESTRIANSDFMAAAHDMADLIAKQHQALCMADDDRANDERVIREQAAEIERLRTDAERYRRLRNHNTLAVCDEETSYYMEELDAALDKGIERKEAEIGTAEAVIELQAAEDWLRRLESPNAPVQPRICREPSPDETNKGPAANTSDETCC